MTAVCFIFTLLAGGSLAAAGYLFPDLFLAAGFPARLAVIKGAALAYVALLFLPRQFAGHLRNMRPDLLRLRPMVFWSLAAAFSLGLMASGMFHAAGVSERISLGGWPLAAVAAFCCFAAFFGTVRPGLYSGALYLTLLCAWLVVPTAGMEAYMYSEGISPHSAYAAKDWKWTYGFCAVAAVSAIRLLILRQDLLRNGKAQESVQEALRSFVEEKTEKQ